MAKLYGKALAEQVRGRLLRNKQAIEDRHRRIAEGHTDMDDCFMSQRVEEQAIIECKMQLKILAGDGLMEINVVVDDTGAQFEPRWVNTRYGSRLVANGVFANSLDALLKKTGWKLATKMVPCWTKFIAGSGGGMCGVYTGRHGYCRWHTNMVTGEYVGFED